MHDFLGEKLVIFTSTLPNPLQWQAIVILPKPILCDMTPEGTYGYCSSAGRSLESMIKTYINYTDLETTIATWRTNHELMACVCGKID
jgi:hypothetical protein